MNKKDDQIFFKYIQGVKPINRKNRIKKDIKKTPKNIINQLQKIKKLEATKEKKTEKITSSEYLFEIGKVNKMLRKGQVFIDKKIDFHGKILSQAEDEFQKTVIESYKYKTMNLNTMPSQRQIRFGEVIRSIISESFIREDFFNPDVDTSTITVSFVRMSKDLKIASVYIMPLGGKKKDEILKLLNDNKYIFQKFISKAKLKSKNTPKINFYIDDTFDEAEKIENLLLHKNVMKDLNEE